MTTLTDQEFAGFQRFIFDAAGITLSDAKKVDVTDAVQQIAPSIFRVRS